MAGGWLVVVSGTTSWLKKINKQEATDQKVIFN